MSTPRQRVAGHPRRVHPTAHGLRISAPASRWRLRRRRSVAISNARPRHDWSQALTSLVALGALVFTGVSVVQSGRQNAQQDNLTAQGQITDRYTAAVDQIGSTTLDIRLGGIYALERIMRDSPTDQPTIVEVLSAFIRDHAPGSPTPPKAGPLRPPTDIIAALTVLHRRNSAHDGASVEDLSKANLANLDLTNIALSGANLDGANLDGANLFAADLTGADLDGADLTGANLDGANLPNARLFQAKLSHADLGSAILTGANLDAADLTGANLLLADLNRASLRLADLTGADLTGANLDGANLTLADLTHASLASAYAAGTSLCNGSSPTMPSASYRCTSSP